MTTPTLAPVYFDTLPADCAACSKPLAGHVGAHLYAVDGQIVGNALCAHLLHCRIHRLCITCGTPLARVCGHTAAAYAELRRAPEYVIPARKEA